MVREGGEERMDAIKNSIQMPITSSSRIESIPGKGSLEPEACDCAGPQIVLFSLNISLSNASSNCGSNTRNICCLSGFILSNTDSV